MMQKNFLYKSILNNKNIYLSYFWPTSSSVAMFFLFLNIYLNIHEKDINTLLLYSLIFIIIYFNIFIKLIQSLLFNIKKEDIKKLYYIGFTKKILLKNFYLEFLIISILTVLWGMIEGIIFLKLFYTITQQFLFLKTLPKLKFISFVITPLLFLSPMCIIFSFFNIKKIKNHLIFLFSIFLVVFMSLYIFSNTYIKYTIASKNFNGYLKAILNTKSNFIQEKIYDLSILKNNKFVLISESDYPKISDLYYFKINSYIKINNKDYEVKKIIELKNKFLRTVYIVKDHDYTTLKKFLQEKQYKVINKYPIEMEDWKLVANFNNQNFSNSKIFKNLLFVYKKKKFLFAYEVFIILVSGFIIFITSKFQIYFYSLRELHKNHMNFISMYKLGLSTKKQLKLIINNLKMRFFLPSIIGLLLNLVLLIKFKYYLFTFNLIFFIDVFKYNTLIFIFIIIIEYIFYYKLKKKYKQIYINCESR